MFEQSSEDRLTIWAEFRKNLSVSASPLQEVLDFWNHAPRIIHNHLVDPYNPRSWPTPWEIIVNNKYDDFTLSLMIAYTLKLSDRYKDSKIEIKTMVDSSKTVLYNLVYVDDSNILNYSSTPIKESEIDNELYLENLIEVIFPR